MVQFHYKDVDEGEERAIKAIITPPPPSPTLSLTSETGGLLIFREVHVSEHKVMKGSFIALSIAFGMSMLSLNHENDHPHTATINGTHFHLTAVNETNTLFLIICSALVMLMSPSLSLYYGGLVTDDAVLNRMVRTFTCMGIVGVQWLTIGYSLAFAPSNPNAFNLIGDFSYVGMRGVTWSNENLPELAKASDVPHLAYMGYQLMFASITTTILSGGLAEYMSFRAFCLFILLWTTFVYDPMCHAIWGGGLMSWHLDFAGGTVVHLLSGLSATVAATYLNTVAKDLETMREARLTVEALDPAQPLAIYEGRNGRKIDRRDSFDETLAVVHAGNAKEYYAECDHALGDRESAHSPTYVVLGATCMPDFDPAQFAALV